MQLTTKLHVSTPWGHLQAYKIWCRTRYVCNYYLRDPVVYNSLVNCKPRDPVGSIYKRTLYDTIFYKPEDDPMG